jgi:RNA polymerase sigma factor (sigma-70 family)
MFLEDETHPSVAQDVLELSDEKVLFRSLHDPRVFEVIVDRYQEAFIRKAKRLLTTQHDAEDAVQEAFTKIYIYANKFEVQEGATFKSWAYKILINTCFTHGKKKKLNTERFSLIDPEFEHLIADTEDRFKSFTLKEYILSVLSRMPDSLGKVLEDYYIKGVPQKELAEEEGVSVSAIKTRIHRAKKSFKEISNSFTL